MKTILVFLTVLFISFPAFLFAQRGENIESLHTAYLSQKMNLTQEEAEKFWPVYNKYHDDMNALKKQRDDNKETIKKAGGIDNMSDADVQKLISSETDIQSRELELKKQYVAKFEQVVSPKKTAKFFIAEEEFKMYLLKQLMNRRNGGGGMNRRDPEFVPQ
jgi:hypothetical protein